MNRVTADYRCSLIPTGISSSVDAACPHGAPIMGLLLEHGAPQDLSVAFYGG